MKRSDPYKQMMLVYARRCVRDLIDYGFGEQFSKELRDAIDAYNDVLWKYNELVYNKNGLDPDPVRRKVQVRSAYAAYKSARDQLDFVLLKE